MIRFLTHLLIALGVVIVFAPAFSAQANTEGSLYLWQLQRLLVPNEEALEREEKGFIFIYSRLKDTDIDQAMDENFSRIGAMMFVNTIITDKQGEPMTDPLTGETVTDDDC